MTDRQGQRQDTRQDARRTANVRTGLILASIAGAFFVGFMAKMFLLGR